MYEWTEKRIEWYQRAVAYTGFDEKIADAIEPFLAKDGTVCDLGCGTGYVAMALAKRGYRVTAFDKNALTLAYLRSEAQKRGLSNLNICLGDWFALPGAPMWDNVVMVFAGHLDTDLKLFLSLCKKNLILVTKIGDQSHVQDDGISPFRHATPDEIEKSLGGYSYVSTDITAEFSQPFLSEEECREYVEFFGGTAGSPMGVMRRIVRTDGGAYPFYLPSTKQLRIYAVKTEGKHL